jgi:hypothetical protein
MATLSSYTFNNAGRIGADSTDLTQQNVANTQYANYNLTNHFSNKTSDSHVKFATQQPSMNFNGLANGNGIHNASVDNESLLHMKAEQQRPLEKLQLFSRPFATIPYLGRGSCDPAIESQLQQGENVTEKKSVSTVMEKSFAPYSLYPTDSKMENRVNDASNTVEEAALDGWVRGGVPTREAPLKNNKYLFRNNV